MVCARRNIKKNIAFFVRNIIFIYDNAQERLSVRLQ